MTANDFRRMALGMEDAIESAHMGHPDFRVNNRIFATLHHDDQFGMVALSPDEQQQFVRSHPPAFAPENGAWGLQGCTRVRLEAVDEDALGEAMTMAWRRAVAKGAARRSGAAKSVKSRYAATSAPPQRTFSALVSVYPRDVQALARATRSLLKQLLPDARETIDPTGPYVQYSYGTGYKGVVGYITVNQKGVKLGVGGGASLPDPNGLLRGSGKSNRHVVIETPDDLRQPGLRQLVRAALAAWKKNR